ncbi:hypothetical protein OROHE_007565 [Orobanche hederae]
MPIWSNIRDLKPRNFGWNMRLLLVRAYDVLDFAGRDIKTVECIFHDETVRFFHIVSALFLHLLVVQWILPRNAIFSELLKRFSWIKNKRWGSYWICATVKSLGKYGRKNKWYFTECDTCRKGVHDLDPGYYCLECDKEVCAISKRYRLFMKVSDSTASVEVMMWDKQCADVIGRIVSELIKELIDKEIASDEEVSTPKKDKGKEKAGEGMDCKTIKRKLMMKCQPHGQ